MRAVRFEHFGGYDQAKLVDVPEPVPADGEVLVQVRAASVNPFDNTLRLGRVAGVEPPLQQGNEGVGVVVGEGSADLPPGTRVMLVGAYGYGKPGTWAEYVTAGPTEAVRTPDNLTDVEAAAVPVAYLAAQLALTRACALQPGQSILIPGVGGSVANAAIQLARVHGAGRVITSAGRTDKAEQARTLGYSDVIDLSEETLTEGVARLTDGQGVEIVLDSIGGTVTGDALGALATGGRLIQMGYTAGTAATIDVMGLIWKAATIQGFNMYFQPGEAFGEAWGVILKLLVEGTVKPIIDRTYPLEQAAEATRHLIEDRPMGKVVLTL